MVGNVLKAATLGTSTNTRLARELSSGSDTLRRISSSFTSWGKELTIYSFYETEKMPGMNCRVSGAMLHRLDVGLIFLGGGKGLCYSRLA
jgi:hypothetical protein